MTNKGDKKGNVAQGVLVLIILLLAVGGAGFGVGFTQKFAPIEMVSPDTAATNKSAGGDTESGASSSSTPASLKKAYWIHTKGWDRAGYAIKVFINDQPVGTFSTQDRLDDVTKYVKAGDNKIRFQAKALPQGNRNDYTGAYLTITLNQGSKFSSKGYKDAQTLVEYTRKVSETDDFDDNMDFAVVE